MLRVWAGYLAVGTLKLLGHLPPRFIIILGLPWIPMYALVRGNLRRRLNALKNQVPFLVPSALGYYRMRLRVAALSLRHLTGHYQDCDIRVEGEEYYRSAGVSGKPVLLLGWHQGPVELLHRLPAALPDGRPFLIATAGGFTTPLSRFLKEGRKQTGKEILDLKSMPAGLRSWARHRGVLAVMIDQVPGRPKSWLSLWQEALEIPFPNNLWDWLINQTPVFLTVSVRMEKDVVIFRYTPLQPDLHELRKHMETKLTEAPNQYNWSYRKIRVKNLP